MNGTLIDIQGITVSVTPIEMQDSTDKAYIISISDERKITNITVIYGRIEEVCCSFK
jgi:hypothetical protein